MTKKLWLILVPVTLIGISSWQARSKKIILLKYHITGSIMQTASYCEGARPTQEILNKLRTPTGIPYGQLFLKKSTRNEEGTMIIETIRADRKGNFTIDLPPGDYCVIEEWKSKPFKLPSNTKMQTINASCYKKLYETCDYQLNVTDKDMNDLKFVFHRPCYYNLPCITYKGPLPHITTPQDKNE